MGKGWPQAGHIQQRWKIFFCICFSIRSDAAGRRKINRNSQGLFAVISKNFISDF